MSFKKYGNAEDLKKPLWGASVREDEVQVPVVPRHLLMPI